MSLKTISLLFIAVLLLGTPAFSSTMFEGPNGEIYFGEYLPQELREKGYRAKDEPKKAKQPAAKAGGRDLGTLPV